jgi:hypothetical protein
MRHLHGDVLAPRDMIIIQRITRDEFGVVTVTVQNVGRDEMVLSSVQVDGVLNVPDAYEAPVGSPAILGVTELPPSIEGKIVLSGNYSGLAKIKVKLTYDNGCFVELTKKF